MNNKVILFSEGFYTKEYLRYIYEVISEGKLLMFNSYG